MKKIVNNRNDGITLIALVVTIVILLILAGVSISMLTGQNAILNRTSEAKEDTLAAQQEEQSALDMYENEISNYVGIDWNAAKLSAKAPKEQKEERNNDVIGIGTDGKPVNMDYWEYCFDTVTNGYGLNSQEVFQNTEYNNNGTNTSTLREKGYRGSATDTEINGKIPQYISVDNGSTYYPVTSLYRTFLGMSNLSKYPKIPETIKNMFSAFEGCQNIKNAYIPNNVESISWTFNNTGLTELPSLSENIKSISGAFSNCNSLKSVELNIPTQVDEMSNLFYQCENLTDVTFSGGENVIKMKQTFCLDKNLTNIKGMPKNVKSLHQTFMKCENLTSIDLVVSENIEDLTQTFSDCKKLEGTIIINGNPTKYELCFQNTSKDAKNSLKITGKSTILEQLIEKSYGLGNVVISAN